MKIQFEDFKLFVKKWPKFVLNWMEMESIYVALTLESLQKLLIDFDQFSVNVLEEQTAKRPGVSGKIENYFSIYFRMKSMSLYILLHENYLVLQ